MAYYHVFIRSELTYTLQTWPFTLVQSNTIGAAHRKMLRKMIISGKKRQEGDDEDRYSIKIGTEKFMRISNNIYNYIKKQQNKYDAYITRQPNSCYLIRNQRTARPQCDESDWHCLIDTVLILVYRIWIILPGWRRSERLCLCLCRRIFSKNFKSVSDLPQNIQQ